MKVSIVGSLRDRKVACSASDRQGSNFESCVWRTVSSQSSHYPQEVHLAQFSLYVHKGGLKHDSFHFISFIASNWLKTDLNHIYGLISTWFILKKGIIGNGYCHSTVVLKVPLAIFTKPIRIKDFRLWQQLWKCYYHQTNQHQCNKDTDQS